MKNGKLILIIAGSLFAVTAIGGFIWYKSSKKEDDTSKETDGESETKPDVKEEVKVTSNPTVFVPPTGKPVQSSLNVYANSKGVDIKVSAQGTTTDNPVVLGSTVRKTEARDEKLGNFIKYLTIFAIPFVLFTDSYSGRKVLIPKSSVTVK